MRYLMVCAALFAAGGVVTPLAAQTRADTDYAPFRVVGSSGVEVRVDIGARAEHAKSLRRATVLTPAGARRARFVRTERVCEWLCGDGNQEGRECHFEVVLRASAPIDEAVAVLGGSPDVREIAIMPAGTDRPIGDPARWIEAEPIGNDDRTFRWTRFSEGVFLSSQDMGRDFYAPPIDLGSCAMRPVAPFTIVSCPTAELLYEGARGIAVSFADYGEDTVEPLIRFRLNGRDAVVIRLGLKAAVTTALLRKGDDGRWHLSFRPFDYAQLC
jgi:hypothetical protein